MKQPSCKPLNNRHHTKQEERADSQYTVSILQYVRRFWPAKKKKKSRICNTKRRLKKAKISSYPSLLCLVCTAVEAIPNCAEPGLDLPCSFTSCCSSQCLSALLPPVGQKSALYTSMAALRLSSPAWKVQGKRSICAWTSSQHSLSIFRRNQSELPCCP